MVSKKEILILLLGMFLSTILALAKYPGPDTNSASKGNWNWRIYAQVTGYYYTQDTYCVTYHYGSTSRAGTIVYDSPLFVFADRIGYYNYYKQTSGDYIGYYLACSLPKYPPTDYATTTSIRTFYDTATGNSWSVSVSATVTATP